MAKLNHLARITLVFLLTVVPLPAQNDASMPEDEIKAAFLFGFAKFIEWPAPKAGPDAAQVVGVLGRDAFAATLEQTVRGKTVNGKPLVVKRLTKPQEALGCQVVFIGGGDRTRFRPILDGLPCGRRPHRG